MTKGIFQSLILSFTLTACQTDKNSLDERLLELTGVWQTQSSDGTLESRGNQILIQRDSTYQIFHDRNGGDIIESGVLSKHDSLISERNLKYGITRVDSVTIHVKRHHIINGEIINTYRKTEADPSDKLMEYNKIDSIRNQIIGWWAVKKSPDPTLPIKLLNAGQCDSFTMNVNGNGSVIVYRNNYLDSAVEYSYRIMNDGMRLQRYDAYGKVRIDFESDSIMRMHMNRNDFDTLTLKKIDKIKTTGNTK